MDKAEVAKLAMALISDIEGGVLPLELLISKAATLARVIGDMEAIEWLAYEIDGYDSSTPVGLRFAILTARWDGTTATGYFGSASSIASTVGSMAETFNVYRQFQPSGEYAMVQLREKSERVHQWATSMAPLQRVLSDIRAQLHRFALRVFVEAQFSDTSRSIFERFQSTVDVELAKTAAQAFEKLPFVFERLRSGEPEAVSHALTSCRRIIDSFADAVFPAQSEPVVLDGQQIDCGPEKTKNRIRAFLAAKIESASRRERINKNLGALYDRVSAGVHSDVAVDEAQALVLNTYLLLGEIVSLPDH